MALNVIGAGCSRTGTMSLKSALEQLLESPCYHMHEVYVNPEHVPLWHSAVRGEPADWPSFMAGYSATLDWPAALFWPELSAAFPEAIVLLSLRDSEQWWSSASQTVFSVIDQAADDKDQIEWKAMMDDLVKARFTADLKDKDSCIAAFERSNDEVRRHISSDRLVIWKPGDGWAPICAALEVPVPTSPFPLKNTREEFLTRLGPKPTRKS